MNLKTSWSDRVFAKAITKSDLRCHWPWMAAATLLLFFNVLALIDVPFRAEPVDYAFSFFLACVYSILIGTKLFAYLDRQNSVSFVHGLPFSRGKLYLTHLASGFVIVMLPAVVNAVIMLLMGFPSYAKAFTVGNTFEYLAGYAVYTLISLSIAAFSMTFCGNVIVSMAFSCGIVVLPAALIAFFSGLCGMCLHGSRGRIPSGLLKFLYVFPDDLFPVHFLLYVGGAAVFLTAGYFLYKYRPLENCEEVVAFRKTRWLFVISISFILGIVGYLLLATIFENESLFLMLPLSVTGAVGAAMFAKKQVSLRGTGRYVLISVLMVLALVLIFNCDITGYEKRIPAEKDIEEIEIRIESPQRGYETVTVGAPQIGDDGIEKILALHRFFIENKNSVERSYSSDYSCGFEVTYYLKNGGRMNRSYSLWLTEAEYMEYYAPVSDLEPVKFSSFRMNPEMTASTIIATDQRAGEDGLMTFNGEKARRLTEALYADIRENTFMDMQVTSGVLTLELHYLYQNENMVETTYMTDVKIGSAFKNTIAFLEEAGFFDGESERIEKIRKINLISSYSGEAVTITGSREVEAFYRILPDLGTPLELRTSEYYSHLFEVVFSSPDLTEEAPSTGETAIQFSVYIDPEQENFPDLLKPYFVGIFSNSSSELVEA